MTQSRPIDFVRATTPEDAARADMYALLARLFYAGPDAGVLGAIVAADGLVARSDAPLALAWRDLQSASAETAVQTATDEYTRLFVGVGKAPVSIYASHYLTDNFKELTLVHLREELDRLGLARKAIATEPEDHLAGLLDVMRFLLQRSDGDVAAQASFFNSYLKPWIGTFCDAVIESEAAAYYGTLCRMMKAYFTIEVEYFEWTV
jgi:TorA maturation chaperone TorD